MDTGPHKSILGQTSVELAVTRPYAALGECPAPPVHLQHGILHAAHVVIVM